MDKKLQQEYHMRSEKVSKVLAYNHFFICGTPKSGTTWIQRLLDTHPEVVCSGEGHFADSFIVPFVRLAQSYNKRLAMAAERVYEGKPYYQEVKPKDMEYIARSFVGLIMSQRRIPEGTKWVGDKTPHYTLRLNLLSRLFPEAKFIHVVRDGRDVITSTCHHAYRAGQRAVIDKTRPEYFRFTAQCAKVWVKTVTTAHNFGLKNPDRYLMVKYEDMHKDPELVLTSIFQFLGVSTEVDTIKNCIQKNEFKALSGGRDKGEENKNSYFRSGEPGNWKKFLTKTALQGVYNQAGKLLKQLGYVQGMPAGGRPAQQRPGARRTKAGNLQTQK